MRADDFVAWGGRPWRRLVRRGLDDFAGPDLAGRRVLEIGAHDGRMSTLLALRGAEVVGVDIKPAFVARATAEAERAGVGDRVRFLVTDGTLAALPDDHFDLVFTKSVLVTVRDLPAMLDEIAAKLRAGGRFVFVENGRGPAALNALRRRRRVPWNPGRVHYFGEPQLAELRRRFDVELVARARLPPVYLICGRARAPAPARGSPCRRRA